MVKFTCPAYAKTNHDNIQFVIASYKRKDNFTIILDNFIHNRDGPRMKLIVTPCTTGEEIENWWHSGGPDFLG
jgi:hypothetical protein